MSIETILFASLQGLVAGRCYADAAPELTARPYITYQQVGGAGLNFIDAAVPSKKNGRFQINVWADSRSQASPLAGQVEDTLRAVAALQTTVLAAPVATYDPDTKLKGTRQDFSFWL